MNLDAGIAHTLEERAVYMPATHIVVNDTHLHTLFGLGNEGVGHEKPQGIILEDVSV